MIILQKTGGIAVTNAFLVADEKAGKAVLFDAPDHTVGPLLEEARKRNWEIIGLWLTHGHFDHIADHAEVTSRFPKAKVLIHALDEPKLLEPNSAFFELPFTIPPRAADEKVSDVQKLQLGNLQCEVIHTPGHSPGHVMYHFPDQKILIGGDLIIGGSVGRTDLPDSNHAQLNASIRRIMQLPDDTRLFPGHGSPSSLADERRHNPYVRAALGEESDEFAH